MDVTTDNTETLNVQKLSAQPHPHEVFGTLFKFGNCWISSAGSFDCKFFYK